MTTAKIEFSLGYNMKIVIKWGDQALVGGTFFELQGKEQGWDCGGGDSPHPPSRENIKICAPKIRL